MPGFHTINFIVKGMKKVLSNHYKNAITRLFTCEREMNETRENGSYELRNDMPQLLHI